MLNQKIKALRLNQGIKAKFIADAFGKSPSWLSLIESGRNKLGSEYVKQMAELLGVSVEDLLSEEEVFDSKIFPDEQAATSA